MARADQDKARQFFKDIKSGPVAGVYLFHGDERYLVERAIDAVQKRVLGADEDDDAFRMQKLRAGDVGAKTLIESARTVPMLGGQQMLVVRDCERFSDEEIAQLAEYAAKASKRSCLVLCANKVDGRKAGWKKLRSAACEVAFAPLYRNQMADWIVRQAKLKKLAISAEAADYLAEAVGTDMALADVALQKLALAESAEISLETAKMLVADTRERSVFELTDAISVRDTGTALKALRNMLEHGAECLAIAFMLARHVRLLLKVKSGLDNGLSENALASYVGVSSYFLRDYLKAAQHFESSELEHIHAKLFEADRLLKGSRRPAALVIESVILEFCQLKPASMR